MQLLVQFQKQLCLLALRSSCRGTYVYIIIIYILLDLNQFSSLICFYHNYRYCKQHNKFDIQLYVWLDSDLFADVLSRIRISCFVVSFFSKVKIGKREILPY